MQRVRESAWYNVGESTKRFWRYYVPSSKLHAAPAYPYLELDEKVEQAIAQDRKNGWVNPYRFDDADVVRRIPNPHDEATLTRPAFIRDIEKILNVPAYNRYAGKTQVFSFVANDDICRRGLHVQLVSRIARTIGATLGSGLGAMLKTLGQEETATSLAESSSSAKKAVDELPMIGAFGGTILSLASAGATLAGTLAGSALSLLKPESLAATAGNGLNDILKKQAEA